MSSFSSKQALFPLGVNQTQPQSSYPPPPAETNSYLMNCAQKDLSSELDPGVSPTTLFPQVTPPLMLSASNSDDVSPLYSQSTSGSLFSASSNVSPTAFFPSRSLSSPLNQQLPSRQQSQVAYPQAHQPSSGVDLFFNSSASFQPDPGLALHSSRYPGGFLEFSRPPQLVQPPSYFDDDIVHDRVKERDILKENNAIRPLGGPFVFLHQIPRRVLSGFDDDENDGLPDDRNGEDQTFDEGSSSHPVLSSSSAPFLYSPEETQIQGRRRGNRQSRRHGRVSSMTQPDTIPPSQQYCKFFQNGTCKRGDQCRFLHKYAPGVSIPASQQQPQQQQRPSSQSPSSDYFAQMATANTPPARRTAPASMTLRQDMIPAVYNQPGSIPKSVSVPPSMSSLSSQTSRSSLAYKANSTAWSSTPLFSSPSTTPLTTASATSFVGGDTTTNTNDNSVVAGASAKDSANTNKEVYGHVPLPPPPLSSFIGHFVEMSLDQNGSRHLQHQFDIATDDLAVGVVLNETLSSLSRLSCDPIAGYMCQKMMEKASHKQRLAIIASLTPNACEVCCNVHGTRTVQKLANRLESDDEVSALKQMLSPWVLDLAQNANGNHVLQKCLHKFEPEVNQYIYDAISDPNVFLPVATHRHGCCVVQRALDYGNPAQCNEIISEVVANLLPLVQDAFGNYVTQYVLQLKQPRMPLRFAQALKGHVAELSMQKFSSNVIEKIMRSGDESAAEAIIDELIHVRDMKALVLDPFANYVIQTALTVSSEAQHRELAAVILPHQTAIRNTLYGKRIMNKVRRDTKSNQKQYSLSEFESRGC